MKTIEGNKLISEFMGCTCEIITLFEKDKDIETVQKNKWTRPKWMTNEIYSAYGWVSYENENYMKYHSSWDWLMPVIHRITCLAVDYTPEGDDIFKRIGDKLLLVQVEPAFKAVVGFMEWYNENITNQKKGGTI